MLTWLPMLNSVALALKPAHVVATLLCTKTFLGTTTATVRIQKSNPLPATPVASDFAEVVMTMGLLPIMEHLEKSFQGCTALMTPLSLRKSGGHWKGMLKGKACRAFLWRILMRLLRQKGAIQGEEEVSESGGTLLCLGRRKMMHEEEVRSPPPADGLNSIV